MTRTSLENLVSTLKNYIKENCGMPFIIAFMLLLLICAALLVGNQQDLANEVAIYAYCLIVVGIILQLASLIKEGRLKPGRNTPRFA